MEAVARELFAAQADLEAVAFNGMRPLHLAAFYDQDNVVSFLCQQQVDLNACSRGYSALDLACLRENPLVVRVLCDCGAERNVFGAVPARKPSRCSQIDPKRNALRLAWPMANMRLCPGAQQVKSMSCGA